jgi:polyferredoxin
VKYLEEFGKGLINFANIGTVLIFLKVYIENFDVIYLLLGIWFWASLYIIGVIAIRKSEGVNNE